MIKAKRRRGTKVRCPFCEHQGRVPHPRAALIGRWLKCTVCGSKQHGGMLPSARRKPRKPRMGASPSPDLPVDALDDLWR